jgi:hypothetical protein
MNYSLPWTIYSPPKLDGFYKKVVLGNESIHLYTYPIKGIYTIDMSGTRKNINLISDRLKIFNCKSFETIRVVVARSLLELNIPEIDPKFAVMI